MNGITFASKREADRYLVLWAMYADGKIENLELQKRLRCTVNGHKVCDYLADFTYNYPGGDMIVEDVKGMKTDVYKLKKKLVKAVYGIDIVEV